jgi:peptidoglycan/xylan/chitin deacetylase (PgdA/CDA1 family)
MKILKVFLSVFFVLFLVGNYFAQESGVASVRKRIAVTFDDLPHNRARSTTNEEMKMRVEKLIAKIKFEKIPAAAFVNEDKLEVNGQRDSVRVKILKLWLDAGVELGNHTYSHKSANKISVEDYEQEILNGERTIKELLAEKGMKLRYFRHPFLQTGLSIEYKSQIEKFLSEHGYTIAPVTFDNAEWAFSAAYDKAIKAKNDSLMVQIGIQYIDYMKLKIRYFENQTQKLFGRQINQIFLIHSNSINSDYFDKLCKMIRGENYEFISLEEALKDEAYKSADTFIEDNGISWLHRWAITQRKEKDFFGTEPKVPLNILKIAGLDSE